MLYAPKCVEKLSEKSRTGLQSSLTGHRNGTFRSILASVYRPNLWLERSLYPFSDSFLTEFSEVHTNGRYEGSDGQDGSFGPTP